MAGKIDEGRIQSDTINLILTDPDLLNCYICCEPLSTPIFQCENGHTSCSSCCSKLQSKCSLCGLKNDNIRCRLSEKLLESIKVYCRNSRYGCRWTAYQNTISKHESSCEYEPCWCPSFGCSFVSSSRRLSFHFRKKHYGILHSFSYDSKFTMCFNNDGGDKFRILQARVEEDEDGENDEEDKENECLFILSLTNEPFGNAATVTRIGSSLSKKKFYYEIKTKVQEHVHRSQSMVKEIQALVRIPPSNGSLLIPNNFFESSS